MNADGSDIRWLAKGWDPAWSPDGRQIAFASVRDGNMDIFAIHVDGSNLTRLTDHPGEDSNPDWAWPAGPIGTVAVPTPARPGTSTQPSTEGAIANTPQPAAVPRYREGERVILTRIEMMSRTRGWAIAGGSVLRTTDGGDTWREVTPPDPSLSSMSEAFGGFLDSERAWVVLGRRLDEYSSVIPQPTGLWHTTDGGNTWSSSLPVLHEAVGDAMWAEFWALDSEHAWVALRGVYVGAGTHYSAHFFRTTNSGATWEPLPDDVGVDYTGMAFADQDVGWLTWQSTGAYAAAPPGYAVTHDGGFSWDLRTLPAPGDRSTLFEEFEYSEPFELNVLSSESIRLLVATWFGLASGDSDAFTGYLYASEDGGETWNARDLPPDVLASDYQLIFFDGSQGLLLGRKMYRTEDAGLTWSPVKTVAWDGQFSFVDPLQGWAIARSGTAIAFVRTLDGGFSWFEVEPRIAR
jgi:photosystem II stability/assembly factor-like uncharacterized protein